MFGIINVAAEAHIINLVNWLKFKFVHILNASVYEKNNVFCKETRNQAYFVLVHETKFFRRYYVSGYEFFGYICFIPWTDGYWKVHISTEKDNENKNIFFQLLILSPGANRHVRFSSLHLTTGDSYVFYTQLVQSLDVGVYA